MTDGKQKLQLVMDVDVVRAIKSMAALEGISAARLIENWTREHMEADAKNKEAE